MSAVWMGLLYAPGAVFSFIYRLYFPPTFFFLSFIFPAKLHALSLFPFPCNHFVQSQSFFCMCGCSQRSVMLAVCKCLMYVHKYYIYLCSYDFIVHSWNAGVDMLCRECRVSRAFSLNITRHELRPRYMPSRLRFYPSMHSRPPIHPPIHSSIHPSIHLSLHLSILPCIHQRRSIHGFCWPISLSLHLSFI